MARDFSGTAQRLFSSSAPVSAAPFSVHAWVNWDTIGTKPTFFSLLTTSNNFHGWYFSNRSSDSKILWEAYDGTSRIAASSTGVSTGVWNSCLGVESSSSSRTVYLNGGNSATDTNSATPSSTSFMTVGAYSASGGAEYFNHTDGKIAEVAIWNAALTAEEAAILAEGVWAPLVRPESLVMYAPILGRTSPEQDIVGGYNLTVTSATQSAHPRIIRPHRRFALGFEAAGGGGGSANPWYYYAQAG